MERYHAPAFWLVPSRFVWCFLWVTMLAACQPQTNNVEPGEGAFYLRLGGTLYRVPFKLKPLITEYHPDALKSELAKGRGTRTNPIDSELFSFRPYTLESGQGIAPVARIKSKRFWGEGKGSQAWPKANASIESFAVEATGADLNDPGSDFRRYNFLVTTTYDDGTLQESPLRCRGHDLYGQDPQWGLSNCRMYVRLSESARLSLRIEPGRDFEKIERDFRASFDAVRDMNMEQ